VITHLQELFTHGDHSLAVTAHLQRLVTCVGYSPMVSTHSQTSEHSLEAITCVQWSLGLFTHGDDSLVVTTQLW